MFQGKENGEGSAKGSAQSGLADPSAKKGLRMTSRVVFGSYFIFTKMISSKNGTQLPLPTICHPEPLFFPCEITDFSDVQRERKR
jgi:hypothetical protein